MPIPTWSPGQVLVASDVNSWFVPLAVVKGGDQSVTSSTVVVNDTALVVAVASSATYQFSCFISYEGGTQGSSDLKWTWTTPAGTAGNVQLQWAQNASSGTATKVHANSWISLWRFA